MQLYRAEICPISSFSSQLQSDTFFGAFCWSYKYIYGEKDLENLLLEMKRGTPPVIFSNAFPTGMLPMPLEIHDQTTDYKNIENKGELKKAFQKRKKLKSAGYVAKEWFYEICQGNDSGFTAGLGSDDIYEQTVVHNMVSRGSGTVENIDGSGNLYEEDELFVKEGSTYDVYILSSLETEVLRKTFEMVCFLGIGKNKSTGKGTFRLLNWQEEQIKNVNANGYVALSNFVPAREDPVDGHYKFLIKYGRLDREYASDDIPFKKPVLFFQAGAVFRDDLVRPYYGRCIEHISIRDEVVTNAYTIAYPIHLHEE